MGTKHHPSSTTLRNSAHIRREVDTLLQAVGGAGASSLFHAIAVEAVNADTGKLKTGSGEEGYVWQPHVYAKKAPGDPVNSRIAAAGASLGRIMAGGHATNRGYLAFLEAIYQVTMTQTDDVTERIAKLWDQYEAMPQEEVVVVTERWYARLWRRFLNWWKVSYSLEEDIEA